MERNGHYQFALFYLILLTIEVWIP